MNIRLFFRSITYAFRGLAYVWKNEQNFRIQTFIACVVIALMIIFRVRLTDAVILVVMIAMVLILELFNTIFEKMVDILKPRMHNYAGIIKDMMASAVLVASVVAVLVGVLILGPYFLQTLLNFM